jgi:hypothetical protein
MFYIAQHIKILMEVFGLESWNGDGDMKGGATMFVDRNPKF